MTRIRSVFEKMWEEEHKGKQIPIAKKSENEKLAYEWFLRGAGYISGEVSKILDGGGE